MNNKQKSEQNIIMKKSGAFWLTLLAFLITIVGSFNWLCIGFFQFDFVAGLFGSQSSIFSRFVYIVVGISCIYLIYAVIRYKGRLTLTPQNLQTLKEKEQSENATNNQSSQTNNNENQSNE